jgi:hypothetical protein
MSTTINEPKQQTIEEKRRYIAEKYASIKIACSQAPHPHNVINPLYGGSDELLTDILEVYDNYLDFLKAIGGQIRYSNAAYKDLGELLKWVARRVGHSPTQTERAVYKKLGILPNDETIQGKFGRRDFTAIYRMVKLPAPGEPYTC